MTIFGAVNGQSNEADTTQTKTRLIGLTSLMEVLLLCGT